MGEDPGMDRRAFLHLGGRLAIVAMTSTACLTRSDDAAPAGGEDPSGATSAGTAGAGTTGTTPGQTLRIGLPSFPGSWDQDFVGFDLVALALYKNTYAYMVDYGTAEIDGAPVLDTTTIVPSIAESWTSDDAGQVWTLTLPEGVTFPSGNPLTAEDVKWSKDRAFAAQANVAGVYRLIGLTRPEQVEVVDERTVRFTQDFPSSLTPQIQAISLYVFDSALAREHATDDDEWAQEWLSTNPVGGGRFTVASQQQGQEVVLEANPDFVGTDPAKVQRVEMPVITSAGTRRLQLESGDIDIALGLGRQDVADLREREGLQVISSPSNEQVRIEMLTTAPPFDDLAVRRAVASAVPYQQIIDNVYGGDARRADSLVPLDMPGHVAGSYGFDHDLDAARRELEEAGVGALEAELVYAANDVEQEQIAILLANELSQVGITLQPTPLDPAALAERRAAKTIPLQITSGQAWVDDVEYLLSIALTEGAFLNYADYVNPEIEEIFAASHTVTDPAEREELWAGVQEILGEEVPWAPICQPNFNLPVREQVSGWVQPVDGLFRLQYLQVS